jgi:hypothetical protein
MALHALPKEDAGDRARVISRDCRPLLNSSERMLLFTTKPYEQLPHDNKAIKRNATFHSRDQNAPLAHTYIYIYILH